MMNIKKKNTKDGLAGKACIAEPEQDFPDSPLPGG
jgi:hypothetical protein